MTESQKNIEKCWDSVIFALIFLNLAMWQKLSMSQTFSMFQKNLEKVWDIEKCLYLCFLLHKISKKQGKNDRVPTFFYVKIFRWTQLILELTMKKKCQVDKQPNVTKISSCGFGFTRASRQVLERWDSNNVPFLIKADFRSK